MKKFVFLMLTAALFVTTGCSNDDDNVNPETIFKSSLEAIYPNVKNVDWEYDRGYLTAEFRNNGAETKVWFDDAANWFCIETDMIFTQIPQNIQTAFNNCEYADWRVDDVDYIQIRENVNEPAATTTYYEFEVEKDKKEKEFVFYADGTIGEKPVYNK